MSAETTPPTSWTPVLDGNAAEAKRWRNIVLGIVGSLLAIGIVMIDSTSAIKAGEAGDASLFLRRQIVWSIIALGALVVAWHTDYHTLGRYSPWLLLAALVLLVVVLFPGVGSKVYGARRWIRLGGVGFQPSELAKVALLLFVAAACAARAAPGDGRSAERGDVPTWLERLTVGMLPAIGAIGLCVGLILLEPDFGTAVFVSTLSGALLFVAGIPLLRVAPFALAGGAAAVWFAATHLDHVRDRLAVFLNPELDPLGKGYQIRQSLLALGSGGVTGLGLGESRQKLFFLPLEHSDFIFAIIGEELGLAGTLLVVGLFAGFVLAGLRIMRAAADPLGYLLAFGVVFLIGLQASLNIAVVTAALPTKGIPLPFVSFGGSSLVISMIGVGILLNVAAQGRWVAPVTPKPVTQKRDRRA